MRPHFPSLLAALFVVSCSAPRTSSDARGIDTDRLRRVDDLVREAVESERVAGASYLVMHGGRVVAQGAHGLADVDSKAPMRADTIVRVYSMTKVVTAVAALQLVEDGVLSLDEPIAQRLPELADLRVCVGGTADEPELEPLAKPITVRNLLNHTAGFTYDFFPSSPVVDLMKRADPWNATSQDDFLRRIASIPLIRQPGVAFDYGISDDVLAALVERASGVRFEEHVARRITGPLGMTDTAFDVEPAKRARLAALHRREGERLVTTPPTFGAYSEAGRGYASGGAGLFSTLRDYARFAQCLDEGGALDGVRILGRKTMELALQDSLPDGASAGQAWMGWGLFAAVRRATPAATEVGSPGMFTWSGAATTHFFADPSERLVALVFAQHFPFDEPRLFGRFRNAVYQALE